MGIVIKAFFIVAFAGAVYFAMDKMLSMALNYGLPVLPSNVGYFISKSGTDQAITIYISIISTGWFIKQIMAYMRSFG